MKVYACVRKGTGENKRQCDDRILVGTSVIADGYHEIEIAEDTIMLAVSDGVGGRAAGWKAAETTLEFLAQKNAFGGAEDILEVIKKSNKELLVESASNESYKGMAATLSVIQIAQDAATVLHLGDSRIYQLRMLQGYSIFRMLTKDQNRLNKWLSMAEYADIDEQELRKDATWRHITTYMGMPTERLEEDIQIVNNIGKSGMFVLTTDGVHDYIEPKEFEEILNADIPVRQKIDEIMKCARENGSVDDQSIIIAL